MLHEPELLRDLKPYEAALYESIDLTGLAAFALDLLRSKNVPTTFENVTVTLFRLFPNKFALIGFPQYPDATRVNRSLLQLRPKYRNWATGKVITGYSLTYSGMKKVQEVRSLLSGSCLPDVHRHMSPKPVQRTHDLNKDLEIIETSVVFDKWKNGKLGQATTMEFLTMIEAYSYTPPKAIKDRVQYLTQIALQFSRDDIVMFFKDIRGRFSNKFEE